MNVFFVSLGCDKNRVDSEKILAYLNSHYKVTMVDEPSASDIAIVNTCGFIKDAKLESIDWIEYLVKLKKDGVIKKIMICGCYATEIIKYSEKQSLMKYVDVVLPHDNYLEKLNDDTDRFLDILSFSSNLKICDGCDKFCTYCIIPYLRGKFKSALPDKLIEETKKLAKNGVRELNIVGQDTLNYGIDFFDNDGKLLIENEKLKKYAKNYDKKLFVPLIEDLSKIDSIKWIRLLYCYPEEIDDNLINLIKNNKKVLHYIDMPIQHIDNKILKLMNRKTTSLSILDTIIKLKEEIKDIVLRTTILVGFPGETEEEFENLCLFVKQVQFDKLGVFTYSREKLSKSYNFKNQVPEEIKEKRKKIIMDIQKKVVEEKNQKYVGKDYEAIVEGYDYMEKSYVVRPYFNARDIDDKVFVKSKKELISGEFVTVHIDKNLGFDLLGHIK